MNHIIRQTSINSCTFPPYLKDTFYKAMKICNKYGLKYQLLITSKRKDCGIIESNTPGRVNDTKQNKAVIHSPVALVTRKVSVWLDEC